ncbi:MAG: glycosyltransferase [Natronomonas sp.]
MTEASHTSEPSRSEQPGRGPISVVLPTVDGVEACREIAALLEPADELVVVCDAADDPIATAAGLPAAARIVTAGAPVACSGKANAVAAGIEAAAHDRIVLTDDDFSRPDDWLRQLSADYERDGPSSELPLFVGCDPLSRLFEPLYAVGSLGLYYTDIAWGGAIIFDRADLDVDRVCAELRRTVSDDGLLSEHLDITQRRRLRTVPIGGTLSESIERHVRFVQIFRWFAPGGLAAAIVGFTALAVVCLLVPAVAGLVIASAVVVYATLGTWRVAVLWTPASVLSFPPAVVYALSRRTFVWAGRRYRWRGKFDTVVESE